MLVISKIFLVLSYFLPSFCLKDLRSLSKCLKSFVSSGMISNLMSRNPFPPIVKMTTFSMWHWSQATSWSSTPTESSSPRAVTTLEGCWGKARAPTCISAWTTCTPRTWRTCWTTCITGRSPWCRRTSTAFCKSLRGSSCMVSFCPRKIKTFSSKTSSKHHLHSQAKDKLNLCFSESCNKAINHKSKPRQ